jgi:hypothetical protein
MGVSKGAEFGRIRQVRWLAVAAAAAAIGLAACGDDDDDDAGTTTAGGSETTATSAEGGEAVLIKTRLILPNGEVIAGSKIGDSPFCVGGTFSDKQGSADIGSVDRTIDCPDGTVRIGFTPGEPQGLTQAGPWRVVSGTGSYEGLEASGEMEVEFESASSDKGRETFTGTAP